MWAYYLCVLITYLVFYFCYLNGSCSCIVIFMTISTYLSFLPFVSPFPLFGLLRGLLLRGSHFKYNYFVLVWSGIHIVSSFLNFSKMQISAMQWHILPTRYIIKTFISFIIFFIVIFIPLLLVMIFYSESFRFNSCVNLTTLFNSFFCYNWVETGHHFGFLDNCTHILTWVIFLGVYHDSTKSQIYYAYTILDFLLLVYSPQLLVSVINTNTLNTRTIVLLTYGFNYKQDDWFWLPLPELMS